MNKIIFWTMAAMAFLLASCAGEEEVTTPADSLKGKPINVDVLVSDIKTRAGYDTDNLPTKFYLTIDQNDTEYDYTNVVMKYEKDKWVAYASDAADAPTVDMIWANATGNVTVTAATFSLSSASTTLNALTDQSTAEGIKASDHLYYSSNAVTPSENGTISIPFDHIMSKLEITVTLRNQYGASENPITSAIAFGSATSATYSHAVATPWSNYNSAVSDISLCSSGSYSAAERTATYEAILIPQNIAASTFGVKVTIGNKSYTWRYANAVTLEGGKKYTLDLTLGKDELTLNTISVSNWNEKTVTGLNAEHIPYVTFTAASEQTFNMYCNYFPLGEDEYFEYSVGGGEWVKFREIVKNIKFGGTLGSLRLRGKSSKGTATDEAYYNSLQYSEIQFTPENSPVDCTGDIRTLIDYEDYANADTKNARFCRLFSNTALRTAPSLPATTLASNCYREMFYGCSALTTAPELPAETLAVNCYTDMFNGCSALTKAPKLPAKSLEGSCYQRMFNGCSKLTTAPELPATTLADNCYQYMFYGCTALTEAPALPAETLADNCYQYMFRGCTSLTTAPELRAETLAWSCCQEMFSGCSSLTTAPELRAETLAPSCYQEMFSGCSKLSSVTMLAINVNEPLCLDHWLDEAGTYVQEPQKPTLYLHQVVYDEYDLQALKYNYSIPEIWTVEPK